MATTFKDTEGREWNLSLSVDTLKRLRERLDVDLMARGLLEVLQKVFGDYVELANVLFVIVEPQAKERGVSDVDFGRALAGDAIEHATFAFMEAIQLFTPNRRDRERVGKLWETLKAGAEAAHEVSDKAMDLAATQLPQRIRSGELRTNSPESPASTPPG